MTYFPPLQCVFATRKCVFTEPKCVLAKKELASDETHYDFFDDDPYNVDSACVFSNFSAFLVRHGRYFICDKGDVREAIARAA